MQILTTKLPTTQQFACSVRVFRRFFRADDLEWVSFGHIRKTFECDGRCHHRPALTGPVVATIAVTRQSGAHVCFYPVRVEEYGATACEDFERSVLPRFRELLDAMRSRPDTAVLGHEELLAEWTGRAHAIHALRYW